MNKEARHALETLGITGFNHTACNLDLELVTRAETIFCMTEEYRQKVIEMFPAVAGKTCCLAEEIDVEDPAGQGPAAYTRLARMIQGLVQFQLESRV